MVAWGWKQGRWYAAASHSEPAAANRRALTRIAGFSEGVLAAELRYLLYNCRLHTFSAPVNGKGASKRKTRHPDAAIHGDAIL